MADNTKLSQAEIDALLNQGTLNPQPAADSELLSEQERDILGEIGNISFGSAATALSTLLQQRVEITTPEVTLHRAEDLGDEFPRPYVMVSVEYTAGIEGTNALAIEMPDAKTIADLMLGGDGSNVQGELHELHLSAVAEAMNQMMGGAATSLSTIFNRAINISPPTVNLIDFSSTDGVNIGFTGWVVAVAFRLRVGSLIDSKIMQFIPVGFAHDMAQLVMDVQGIEKEAAAPVQSAAEPVPEARAVAPPPELFVHTAEAEVSATLTSIPGGQSSQPAVQSPASSAKSIQMPQFTAFDDTLSPSKAMPNLALIMDVTLNVTVELGRTKRAIKDILEMTPGSIVELDKLAGEPVDILVNNRRIATGEVVVIDENFGVRVTAYFESCRSRKASTESLRLTQT